MKGSLSKFLISALAVGHFELLEVFPRYHVWLPPTHEVTFQKGLFQGKIWVSEPNITWKIEGRGFIDEEVEFTDSATIIHLGHARLSR